MDSGENIETSKSFVVVTIEKTSWGGSKKFEDISFENTQTFSVPNGKIQLVPFNDCRWEESVFENVMFSFSQGNTINTHSHVIVCLNMSNIKSEALAQECSKGKVFLKILQNSLKKNCVSSVKWSDPGDTFQSLKVNFFCHFHVPFFLHVFDI